MSKSKLKKEIASFSKEQLQDIILAAYDSSDKAKAYFEFFINPDAEDLLRRYVQMQNKEVDRCKRGCCRARISVLRRNIKEFAGYGVGQAYQAKLIFVTFERLLVNERYMRYTKALYSGICSMANAYIRQADGVDGITEAVDNVKKTLKRMARPMTAVDVLAGLEETCKELTNRIITKTDKTNA